MVTGKEIKIAICDALEEANNPDSNKRHNSKCTSCGKTFYNITKINRFCNGCHYR